MPTQEQPWLHKPRSEVVLNHKELNSFPEITTKLKIAEDLAKSVGKRKKTIHKIVRNAWDKCHNPGKVITTLDLQISSLTVERDDRIAQGKSLHRSQNREWTTCYRELSTEYLRKFFSEEDLKRFLEKREAPYPIPTDCYKFCDERFLSKFPQINRKDWMKFRHGNNRLRFFSLISNALSNQGPQDPSSRQTGEFGEPTPSYHGLGLLATAASNAQLLQAMDPSQESDIPDSDNDGRGASESLCSSVGDDPGKDPPSSGSGERPCQSAFPYRDLEIHGLTDSGSEDEVRVAPLSATGGRRAAPRDSADARAAAGAAAGAAAATGAAGGGATASLESAFPCQIGDGARSAAAGADAGGVGGAQAGGVGGAQASGTGGELTFTESLPLCLSRLTAARADWQPPSTQAGGGGQR